MREMMIDIETLDTERTAAVLQVGLAVVDGDETLARYEVNLDVQSQLNSGRTVSWSTLKFWLEQSDEARASILRPEQYHGFQPSVLRGLERYPAWYVLERINALAISNKVELFWAKGTMDFEVLEHLADTSYRKSPVPWSFRTKRDLRTALDFYPTAKSLTRHNTAHSGLDDALYQLDQLRLVREFTRSTSQQ